tara:strand:+ start:734 stop:955 length:222 start_codon:yes stop_codon:yes gene_type:complete
MVGLKSSVAQKGRYVTQIVHFVGGQCKTIHSIDTETIEQGQFTKFTTKDGIMVLIHDPNVLMIEVFEEDDNGN